MAKIIGLSAMEATMSLVTAPFTETPKEHIRAFHRVFQVRALVSTAWADFHWFMPSVRPCRSRPWCRRA
jgi:hypothetical protein